MKECFYVEVKDGFMIGKKLYPGDKALVVLEEPSEDDVAAVLVDCELLLRTISYSGELNENITLYHFTEKGTEHRTIPADRVKVLGKVESVTFSIYDLNKRGII